VEEAQKLSAKTGYSRLPVYEGRLDNIIGVVYARDLLNPLVEGRTETQVWEVMREPFFVPENKRLLEFLNEMKQKKAHLAIVIDEFGGTSGVASVIDIVEEIVGEIGVDRSALEQVKKVDENTALFGGRVPLERLFEFTQEKFEVPNDISTVGGLLIERFGRIPRKEETIEIDGVSFLVVDADERRVKRVKVTLKRE
ncbi:MAG: CBS domain-containing protein, partial [Planctomycetota bacterium]|nr:CBS domain-containing protein [Planctomycetota bacterium]